MSTTMPLDEAQPRLREVIANLADGDEIALTDGNRIVARIVAERRGKWERPGPGLAQGMMTIVADDDEHLQQFTEYMP